MRSSRGCGPSSGRWPARACSCRRSQDIRAGGRQSNAQYQYTLQGNDVQELYLWAPKLVEALAHVPLLTEVNSDQQQNGLEIDLTVDRDTASRLQLNPASIDNTLYDAFGQRDVSTIYNPLNQYHVVMEVAPQYWQSPETLNNLWISTAGGTVNGTQATNAVARTVTSAKTASSNTAAALAADTAINQATNALANTGRGGVSTGAADSTAYEAMVPLASISAHAPGSTPLAVNHHGTFVATTLSFNLAPNASLSQAVAAIREASAQIGMPADIHGTFAGHRGDLPVLAQQRAAADPRRPRGRLHRARRAVRELHPPHHDPLDAALGRAPARCWRCGSLIRSSASSRSSA